MHYLYFTYLNYIEINRHKRTKSTMITNFLLNEIIKKINIKTIINKFIKNSKIKSKLQSVISK